MRQRFDPRKQENALVDPTGVLWRIGQNISTRRETVGSGENT
jgi:hypothetical protein